MNPKKEGFVKSKRNGNLPMILFLSDTVITNEDQSNFFLTNFPEVFIIFFISIGSPLANYYKDWNVP